MISSFRQPVLNSVLYLMLPSFLFSITFYDIKFLKNYYNYSSIQILNAVSIHIPAAIMSIWVFINRRKMISKYSILNASCWGLLYFFIVDDKVNDAGINGWYYLCLVCAIAPLWIFISIFFLKIGKDMKDPYSNPLIIIKLK